MDALEAAAGEEVPNVGGWPAFGQSSRSVLHRCANCDAFYTCLCQIRFLHEAHRVRHGFSRRGLRSFHDRASPLPSETHEVRHECRGLCLLGGNLTALRLQTFIRRLPERQDVFLELATKLGVADGPSDCLVRDSLPG